MGVDEEKRQQEKSQIHKFQNKSQISIVNQEVASEESVGDGELDGGGIGLALESNYIDGPMNATNGLVFGRLRYSESCVHTLMISLEPYVFICHCINQHFKLILIVVIPL